MPVLQLFYWEGSLFASYIAKNQSEIIDFFLDLPTGDLIIHKNEVLTLPQKLRPYS